MPIEQGHVVQDVLDVSDVREAQAADEPVDLVAFLEQEFHQVGTVLPRRACDERGPAHRMRSSRPRFNAIAARAWPSFGPTGSSMDRYVPDSDAEPAEPTFHVGRSRLPIRIAKSAHPHGLPASAVGVV